MNRDGFAGWTPADGEKTSAPTSMIVPVKLAPVSTAEHDFFPEVDPRERPTGRQILVQIAKLKEKSKGGIIFTDTTRSDAENTLAFGKVIATGYDAYRDSSSVGEFGHKWAQVGDIVRFPRYSPNKFTVKPEDITFVYLDDTEIYGILDGVDHLI